MTRDEILDALYDLIDAHNLADADSFSKIDEGTPDYCIALGFRDGTWTYLSATDPTT